MFGPDYKAGCPSCSSIADGFNGIAVHLANHDVMLCGGVAGAAREAAGLQAADGVDVSLGVLVRQRLQLRLQRLVHRGSSSATGGDRIQLPARRPRDGRDAGVRRRPVAQFAATCGTDVATYVRDRPGMSAFVREDGVVYHTYSTYARGWTASGACTSGSTARPGGATRPASGGAATTSTTIAEPRRKWIGRNDRR